MRTTILGCTDCGGRCNGKEKPAARSMRSTGRLANPAGSSGGQSLFDRPLATVAIEIPNSELMKLGALVFGAVMLGNYISNQL